MMPNMVDMKRNITIDGNSYISFKLKPHSNLVFSFFPIIKHSLNYWQYKRHLLTDGKTKIITNSYINHTRVKRIFKVWKMVFGIQEKPVNNFI